MRPEPSTPSRTPSPAAGACHAASARRPTTRWLPTLVSLLIAAPLAAVPPTAGLQTLTEIPEDLLLDVSIQLLSPNLPPGLEDWEMREVEEIYPDVRRAEARYIPVQLMQTLQSSGQWGAVRVVPVGAGAADVRIGGVIEESTGSKLALYIHVVDSSGEKWLSDRYKLDADLGAYQEDEEAAAIYGDPFGELYHRIARDLVAAREKLDEEEIRELRRITELRFAADLAPQSFDGYLEQDRKGRYEVVRLPAEGDPMLERVREIRQRDYLLIDTLSEHYAGFHARMEEPYDSWRKFAYLEEEARREIRRKARKRKLLGALSILGGVLVDADNRVEAAARDAAIFGGVAVLQSGIAKGREAKIHEEALQELASSFDAEVEPILVDVEGQTLKLTGSVETQFKTWRRLLRDLFLEETGMPVDPDTGEPVTVELPADAVAAPEPR